MNRVPQGRDKYFSQINVRRWMHEHGAGSDDFRVLADDALVAFGMDDVIGRHLEPGDHWIWDVAIEVMQERRGGWGYDLADVADAMADMLKDADIMEAHKRG